MALSSCKPPSQKHTHRPFSWALEVDGRTGIRTQELLWHLLLYGRSVNRHDIISSGKFPGEMTNENGSATISNTQFYQN